MYNSSNKITHDSYNRDAVKISPAQSSKPIYALRQDADYVQNNQRLNAIYTGDCSVEEKRSSWMDRQLAKAGAEGNSVDYKELYERSCTLFKR